MKLFSLLTIVGSFITFFVYLGARIDKLNNGLRSEMKNIEKKINGIERDFIIFKSKRNSK